MSEKWVRRIALALAAIPVALIVSTVIWPMKGSASRGKVVDGRYYVRTAPGYREVGLAEGYREVSEETWRWQYRREVALRTSFAVALFTVLTLGLFSRAVRDAHPRTPNRPV